ncbi:2-oxoacid:acceptor oxidoreductase family protein [Thermodesulfobacteriota bacterium]
MIGIRIHGRGGQGGVTFAHILSMAATFEGKFGQSSQALTIERRGAPTAGFARIGDRVIAERGMIADPDYVVVIDPTIMKAVDVEAGMPEKGLVVANAASKPEIKHPCVFFDATSIALDILKRNITNTVMLGGFVAATDMVSMDSIEQGARFILGKKMPENILEQNISAIRRAYEEVKNG